MVRVVTGRQALRRLGWGRGIAVAWVLLFSVVLTYRDVTFRNSVTEGRRAQCMVWKGNAESDLRPGSTDVARSLVRTAADAYKLVGYCDRLTGPLGAVSPLAYLPAPSGVPPTPSPSPAG